MSEIKLKQEVIDSIQERIDKECYFVDEEWVISSDEVLEIVADVLQKTMERIVERLQKMINRTKEEEKQNNDVVDTAMRYSYEHSMKIFKEEGGIE